jgi:hypothetical protein
MALRDIIFANFVKTEIIPENVLKKKQEFKLIFGKNNLEFANMKKRQYIDLTSEIKIKEYEGPLNAEIKKFFVEEEQYNISEEANLDVESNSYIPINEDIDEELDTIYGLSQNMPCRNLITKILSQTSEGPCKNLITTIKINNLGIKPCSNIIKSLKSKNIQEKPCKNLIDKITNNDKPIMPCYNLIKKYKNIVD